MHWVMTLLEKFSSISCSSTCMWINSNSVTVSVIHNNNKTTKSRWQQSNHFVQNLVLQSNIVLINVKLVKVKQKGAPREDVSCCWAGNRKCANIPSFPICSVPMPMVVQSVFWQQKILFAPYFNSSHCQSTAMQVHSGSGHNVHCGYPCQMCL